MSAINDMPIYIAYWPYLKAPCHSVTVDLLKPIFANVIPPLVVNHR